MKNLKLYVAAAACSLVFAGAAIAESPEEMIASADPAHGETVFRQCKACHTVEKGGPNRVGPNLWGVVGRKVASVEGYNYSPAMKAFGGEWTPDRLFEYLANPRATVPGTRMTFAGLKSEEDRAAVIAYLQTQSDEK